MAPHDSTRTIAGLELLIDWVPTAIIIVDGQGRIALCNAQASRLFGYTAAEILGQMIDILMPDRFRSGHLGLRTGFVQDPKTRPMGAGRDLFGLRKDGTEFPIEIGLNPITTGEGLFVVSAIADISERKRQAEVLERSNMELQRFALLASHDLQTPMRSIASFVQLLQSTYADKLDSQANDWISRTQQSVRHLQILIQDLLEYSRVDSQAHPFQRVSIRDVFDHALLLLDASVRESGAEVICGELPVVTGDRSQLVQLMQNLIGNALKYRNKKPPHIHVSAEQRGNEWIIAVRDNGIGIAPKYHQKIFEIFQRLHDQQEYPGTGIGLAVCRRVVERHGGRIWVESEAGRGSVFHFTLRTGTVKSA
jgi:PAS domain S-box-containing protein